MAPTMAASRTKEVWGIKNGESLGPFRLGSTIAEALHALKSRIPVRPMEIIYNANDPYVQDVVIDSPEDGLKLYFDSVQQILKMIYVYEVNLIPLKYGRVVIFGGDIAATFQSVYNLFGPTNPGKYESADKSYYLGYDGLSIRFPIPDEYRHLYQNKNDLPMELPNGLTPAATGLRVFEGKSQTTPPIPRPIRKYYFEKVEVHVCDHYSTLTFNERKRSIGLGFSPQEIISELGPPMSVFRKSEGVCDEMCLRGQEYFHNYPHLGIDIGYNTFHEASMVVLRTNAIGHPDFGAYHKCNFRITFSCREAFQKKGMKNKLLSICPETPWKEIERGVPSGLHEPPIVNDNGLGLHPFGSTYCHGYIPGCSVEVLKSGYIASVTVLRPTGED